jgi:16S rRNA (uracil1498-N3)-methyltransferase
MRRAKVVGLRSGVMTLPAAVSHHLGHVLRLRSGDAFTAFDPTSRTEAIATVIGETSGAMTIEVGACGPGAVVASETLALLQGLPKGDKADAIVRDATELGVSHVTFVATARSIVKLDAARAEARRERWQRIAEEAARQCGRTDVPAVNGPTPLEAALEAFGDAARFTLYEEATAPLGPLLAGALPGPVAFLVGPEGGLGAEEVRSAEALGWQTVSIGPFVLRTETVAAAVLGAVRVLATLEDTCIPQ